MVKAVATEHGVCIRPIPVRRIDPTTGDTTVIDLPCGATLTVLCPPCAERKRKLRMAQCREGWHLETEPGPDPQPVTDEQRWLVTTRARIQTDRDTTTDPAAAADLDALLADIDTEISRTGLRGHILTGRSHRRVRTTRRRQDAPDLPRRAISSATLGRSYSSGNGATFRPSMFVTLTLGSYGRVNPDGTPVDPDSYDYRAAARDAIHFAKLFDRFIQNLRRVAGYDVQYFATVESQRRLSLHVHIALRGTLPRAEIRQLAAATYHQVWWPKTDQVIRRGPSRMGPRTRDIR